MTFLTELPVLFKIQMNVVIPQAWFPAQGGMYWLRSFRNDAWAMPGSVRQIPSRVMTNIITLRTTNKVIKSSLLRWVGHIARMDDNELPKKIL